VSPLDPRKSGLPDLRRLTADLGQARDRCLATIARDTRDRRHAKRTVGRSLVSRCQTAQSSSFPRRVPASGFVFPLRTRLSPVLQRANPLLSGDTSNPISPRTRGGWSADRALFCFVARARRDLRALRRGLSRSERDLSRRSTTAIFGRGPTPPPPGVKDRSRQRLVRKPQGRAEGSLTSRGSGSRRSRGRHSPLRLQDRLRRRPS
jgi:hypothetical protein